MYRKFACCRVVVSKVVGKGFVLVAQSCTRPLKQGLHQKPEEKHFDSTRLEKSCLVLEFGKIFYDSGPQGYYLISADQCCGVPRTHPLLTTFPLLQPQKDCSIATRFHHKATLTYVIMSKLLTVFGATGQQGGNLIEYTLQHAELSQLYRLRGVTRDVSKATAVALQEKGVEMVQVSGSRGGYWAAIHERQVDLTYLG